MEEIFEFVVVIFLDENKVEAVPKSWLLNNKAGKLNCRWPPSDKNVVRLIQKCVTPASDWYFYTVRQLGDVCDSYEEACKMRKIAEDTSDISGCDRKKRGIKPERSEPPSKKLPAGCFPASAVEVTTELTSQSNLSTPIRPVQNNSIVPRLIGNHLAVKPVESVFDDQNILSQNPSYGNSDNRNNSSTSGVRRTQVPFNNKDLRFMLNTLDGIEARQRKHDKEFEELRELFTKGNTSFPEDEPLVCLPLRTIQDVDKLEIRLINDPGVKSCLKRKIRGSGGKGQTKTTTRAIRKLMTRNLMCHYSKAGRRGKRNFSGLQLADILKDELFILLIDHLMSKFNVDEDAVGDAFDNTLKHESDGTNIKSAKNKKSQSNQPKNLNVNSDQELENKNEQKGRSVKNDGNTPKGVIDSEFSSSDETD